ncbi:MAG: hypothetical protein WDO71_00430 [Bacteroidota bacterium]
MKLLWILQTINMNTDRVKVGVRPKPTTANPTGAKPNTGQWSFGERFQPGMTQVLFNALTVPYEPTAGHYYKILQARSKPH